MIQSLFRLRTYIDERYHWYIINDIGKSFYQTKIGKHHKYSNHGNNAKKDDDKDAFVRKYLSIPTLSEAEHIWLTELYQLTKSGKKFTYRELWARLSERLPRNFKPAAVDERLLSSNGEDIRVLGVVAVEGNFGIIDQIDKIVDSIRKIILKNEEVQEITIEEIATICGLTAKDVSFSLELANFYVNLYRGSSYKDTSTILHSINVSGSEAVFYNYLHFEGIEFYLMKQDRNENYVVSPDDFSADDIFVMNEKLDFLMEQMQKVVLSQQFTYDDMMDELNELKQLYGLKKKNWKRLLVAKVGEMCAGGLVSSLVAEPLADIIKPELSKLLTQ